MDESEIEKRFEALLGAVLSLKASYEGLTQTTDKQAELLSRRLTRVEKKLKLENGTLALDSVPLPQQKSGDALFLEMIQQHMATPQKAEDDACVLPKKRGRPKKKSQEGT